MIIVNIPYKIHYAVSLCDLIWVTGTGFAFYPLCSLQIQVVHVEEDFCLLSHTSCCLQMMIRCLDAAACLDGRKTFNVIVYKQTQALDPM